MAATAHGENQDMTDVHATVHSRDATRPPEISFTFQGLQDPVGLWDELIKLGWDVPDRPTVEAEIDWNSPEGASYRLAPFLVENFAITPNNWPTNLVAERSLATINILRRLGVELDVPIAYLAFLRRTQVAILKDPSRAPTAEAKVTSVPNTLLLSRQPWSALVDEDSVVTYETAVGPGYPKWYWTESKRHSDDIGATLDAQDAVLGVIELGWELLSRMEAPRAFDGRDRILRFIVQDVRDGSEMLTRLQGLVGDQCASMLMRPIRKTEAVNNCLLIVCVVPAERFADIGSQIIAEFPAAIGRGRRYSASANSAAA